MMYSSLCHIDESAKLEIPSGIFKPLLIGGTRTLWCVYSNTDETSLKERHSRSFRHNITITPIAPSLWPVTARINIALIEKPGALYALANFLAEKKISIIHAESSRTNNQYATWNLHVVFEYIQNKPLNYIPALRVYEEIKIEAENLEKSLKRGGTQIPIFKKETDTDHDNYVSIAPNTDLHSINEYIQNTKDDLEGIRFDMKKLDFILTESTSDVIEDELYYRIWILALQDWLKIIARPIILSVQRAIKEENHILSSSTYTDTDGADFCKDSKSFMFKSTNDLKKLFEKIQEDDKISILNSYAIGELNINSLLVRLSIIPKESQKCFFKISITFENKQQPGKAHSCLGIISALTKIIYKYNYNIINSSICTTFYHDTLEIGDMAYLINDYILEEECSESDFLNRAINVFNIDNLNNAEIPSSVTIQLCSIEQLKTSQLPYNSKLEKSGVF